MPTGPHDLRNILHAILLMAGIAAIAFFSAAAIWGPAGGLLALLGIAGALALAPMAPIALLLRAYGARPLERHSFPLGVSLLEELSHRAGLPRPPTLWYIPSAVPNAFATGTPGNSAIAMSDGMLRLLDARELAGVLAHEVSHVANRDLWLMALADGMGRLVAFASLFGQFLLAVNVPLLLLGYETFPWTTVILLVLAPAGVNLLQLALSRTREFDADLGAARLTGDPAALARALAKLERRVGRVWEDIFMPGRRVPQPSLLRTHPPTDERIKRLMALVPEHRPTLTPTPFQRYTLTVPTTPPRWRRAGFWY